MFNSTNVERERNNKGQSTEGLIFVAGTIKNRMEYDGAPLAGPHSKWWVQPEIFLRQRPVLAKNQQGQRAVLAENSSGGANHKT